MKMRNLQEDSLVQLLATGVVTATSVAFLNKKCAAQAVAPETKQAEEENDIKSAGNSATQSFPTRSIKEGV